MTKTVQKRVGLSDLAMQSNPTGADQWFPDDGGRTGHGKLYGRITKRGERSFVLRYTDPDGRYVNWLIGRYEPKASGPKDTPEAWVLAQAVLSLGLARRKATLLSAMHANGTRDLRGHFDRERQIAEAAQAAELARIEADRVAALAAVQAEVDRADAAVTARRDAERFSLRALLEAYVRHLERGKKASAADVRRTLALHVYAVADGPANLPAREVTPRQITTLLRRLTEAGKGRTASKMRSFMRAAYQLAFQADLNPDAPSELVPFGIENNPVAPTDAMTRYAVARERVLTASELRVFLERAAKLPQAQADAVRLALLLGGQRPTQLLRVERNDVDLEAGTVTLRDPKGKRAQARKHVLPLVGEAREIVERLDKKAMTLGVPWLFTSAQVDAEHLLVLPEPTLADPSPDVSALAGVVPMRMETVSSAVSTLAAGLLAEKKVKAPFQMRDIRRTAETMLAALGIDRETRAQVLSHGISGVQAKHYDRHDYLPEKTRALNAWEARLGRIAKGEKEPGVLDMADARERRGRQAN